MPGGGPGVREVVERVVALAREGRVGEARSRYEGYFLAPRHFEDLARFARMARRGVEVVEAGEYLLLYPGGRDREAGVEAAERLAWEGGVILSNYEDAAERGYCRGASCGPGGPAFPGVWGLAGVAGVDRDAGRLFFHPLPPELAGLVYLVPPESRGDEELVRELMGFDLQPWEAPSLASDPLGGRLRVQGDLVLDLRPMGPGGFESLLALSTAVLRASRLALEAVARATEALAVLPEGAPEDRLGSIAGELVGAVFSRVLPCTRVRARASRPLPQLVVVDVELADGGERLGECAVRELTRGLEPPDFWLVRLLDAGAWCLDAGGLPGDPELGPASVMGWLLRVFPDDEEDYSPDALPAAAGIAADSCPAAPDWRAGGRLVGGDDMRRCRLTDVARRPDGGVVVVRYSGFDVFYRLVHVYEAVRVRLRLALGDAGPVVEALGEQALAGPLEARVGRHALELEEAGLIRLHPAVAGLLMYPMIANAAMLARLNLNRLMPREGGAGRGGRGVGEELLERAWSDPDAAKGLVKGLARLYYATAEPRAAIAVTRPQVLRVRHPEHGESRVLIPRPFLAIPRFIPRATLGPRGRRGGRGRRGARR